MKSDRKLIDMVAGTDYNYSSRMEALDRIDDQSVFKYLAENAQDDWIRLESASRGEITTVLQEMLNHPDERICFEAAIELNDQERLTDLVISGKDMFLKDLAINFIDNIELLENIINNCSVDSLRVNVAIRLGNKDIAHDLICNLKAEQYKLKLAQFASDTQMIEELAEKSQDEEVKLSAREWLEGFSGDDT